MKMISTKLAFQSMYTNKSKNWSIIEILYTQSFGNKIQTNCYRHSPIRRASLARHSNDISICGIPFNGNKIIPF